MLLKKWEDLPVGMQNDSVRPYYEALNKKRGSLAAKRIFDMVFAIILFVVLLPILLLIGIAIKLDSHGSVLFLQKRVTQYGRLFCIYKFRTMVPHADKAGTLVTTVHDNRVTKVGKVLRKFRLDELPQLLNIISGDMSFVGTRPEVEKYVKHYSDDMMATLLLPAGVTSEASITYKDEERLLMNAEDADEVYINEVLPEKMAYNLESIATFSFSGDLKTMLKTVFAVFLS